MADHSGFYAPSNPRLCHLPGGPCKHCQARIDTIDTALAAEALILLSVRPAFLEPCPDCNAVGHFATHASIGAPCCNGCSERLCMKCLTGARYYCPLRKPPALRAPLSPLLRQQALGVQSPKAQEKGENK